MGGIFWEKILRYYDTKAVRSNRNVGRHYYADRKLYSTHFTQAIYVKKAAFTLAEVLITLAIIGIVAAMTMPTLIGNYTEKQTVTKLKETYSILNEAIRLMIVNEGNVNMWGASNDARMSKFETLLPEYVQLLKKCEKVAKGCLPSKYKNLYNSNLQAGFNGVNNSYVLKNGASFRVSPIGGNCTQNMAMTSLSDNNIEYGSYGLSCGSILIDIDGIHGKNTLNIDAFDFYVYTDGLMPAGSANETIWTDKFENQCLGARVYDKGGGKCAAWVIYNGNMDYLHCPEKLGWDKARSCND